MIALKLAQREIKNNFRYWLFFSLNLSIGLIGFTFIFLFRENVSSTLEARAKTLLSSDMAISGRRALSDEERNKVALYLRDKITNQTQLTELYSMGRVEKSGQKKSRLVHIKVIEGQYPLLGSINLKDGRTANIESIKGLQTSPKIWVSPEVKHQFKLDIGESITLGKQSFEVSGVIKSDTTSSMRGVSLAPKVYIGKSYLKPTGLISFGTVAWYTDFYIMKKEFDTPELKTELYKRISDPAIYVRSPKDSSEQLSRVINYLSDYLGLIGVVALLISAVGASYLFQSYIFDRLKQIGILKALGVAQSSIISSFIIIISVFGVLSTLISLAFSWIVLPVAISYLKDWFKGDFQGNIDSEVILVLMSLGILINLILCIPIILRVFKSHTNQLLNSEMHNNISYHDYLMYVPAILGLWGLSIWQAHSFIIGTIFTVALLIVFGLVLLILPKVLNRISTALIGKEIKKPFNLAFGFGLRLLVRNKLSTLLTILCLSIGVTLLSVIGQLDKSLKTELVGNQTTKPSLFMFDIQDEQIDGLKKLISENNYPLLNPTPMVRARLIKKNGEKIKRKEKEEGFTTREEEQRRRFNNRGVNLSYANGLNLAEELIAGKPFSGRYSGEGAAEVSLEKRYAQRLRVGIGDTLTYEVLGVEIQAKIVSLRKVKWTSFLPNFFIVFQPGVLEDAPKTFLAAIDKVSFEKQLEIQDKIVEEFPNISILNVTEIISKILTLFNAMAWAVGVMSICCISVGLFVLYSILQSQIHKKQKDLALQKLMGMDENKIFGTLFYEYFLMVISSQFIGTTFGVGLAYIVSHLFLDGIFVANWEFFLGFNLGLMILAVIIIFISYKNNYRKSINSLLEA